MTNLEHLGAIHPFITSESHLYSLNHRCVGSIEKKKYIIII